MKMFYSQEPYEELVGSFESLMQGHWDETESFNDKATLAVNHAKLSALSQHGVLSVTTARDEEGVLTGIAAWIVFDDPKHAGTTIASNIHFFVSPNVRGALVGSRLITESERFLRSKGVKLIGICVKEKDKFMPLVKRHGFERPQTTWFKWIGD